MELAKKYALVPEENLSKHVPTKQQMSEFDTAMSKILNSTLPDHEKVIQYFELLKRKMNLQEFNTPWMSKPPKPTEKETSEPEEEPKSEPDELTLILSSVPPSMKRQARSLLDFLKNHPRKFEWDKNLTISFEGKPIPESNIADLFHLLFSVNKKTPIKAQNELLKTLREMYVPESFIKNRHLSSNKKHVSLMPTKKIKVDPYVMQWENL